MKKIVALLMCMSLFLCGCSEKEKFQEGSMQKELETQETLDLYPDGVTYCVDYDMVKHYDTVPEFLDSEFCQNMEEDGFAPYLLSYDESRFELNEIRCDGKFYEYSLKDTVNDIGVTCSIRYDGSYKEIENLYEDVVLAIQPVITPVEKDGVSYDVAVNQAPYVPEIEYAITYIPIEGYVLYIDAGSAAPEEALAYIHDFDLVPAEETVEQPTETQAVSSGEELAYHVDADNTTFYTSEEEFFSSEFCQTMKDNGFVPYQLSYDTGQYQFFNIRSDAKFYNYNLKDRETGERLSVTITYDTYRKDVSEFGDNVRIPMETTITTAVKDDVEYDVYVYRDPYETEPEYSLRCLPIEGYEFSISSKCTTEEEIIALFQQLDLVPATE